MKQPNLVVLLYLVSAGAVGGLFSAEPASALPTRSLLQKQLNCKLVNRACKSCRMVRSGVTKKSELVCTVCETGWRLRRDASSKTCDCIPGMALNGSISDPAAWCTKCPVGVYCPGGDRINKNSTYKQCADGLETTAEGAKSEMQCFTKPGYGRVAGRSASGNVLLMGQVCAVGTYNDGGNTAGCQRCNPGLTTVAEGATSTQDCVAPPGSFYDNGQGRKCQRGTFSSTYTRADEPCIPCDVGVTTPGEGSDSEEACSLAERGWYMSSPVTAAPCPVDTYSETESNATSCTQCPNGLQTVDTGSEGLAECLAPPGYELKADNPSGTITECEMGFYKEGWNRNPCLPCGPGLVTSGAGAVSRESCWVPAGWGLIAFSPTPVAAMCTNSTYGDSVARPAMSNARCVACAPNMYTEDELTGTMASSGYMREEDCKVKPGWGTTNTDQVEQCLKGFYNPGINRLPCQKCPEATTTLNEGSINATACVVVPGWELDPASTIPHPCDVGEWSAGGTVDQPGGSCTPCAAGFTTQEQESTSSSDCNVCQAGYGGAGCTPCPYNTYSMGTLQAGAACPQCAAGSVSARRTANPDQCYEAMQLPSHDIINLSAESYWESAVHASSAIACSLACESNSSCVMYRWGGYPAADCQLMFDAPTATPAQQWGFKLPYGNDYVIYLVPVSLSISRLVAHRGDMSIGDCMRACSRSGACEVMSFPVGVEVGACQLWRSELDADYSSMWHAQGSRFYSDRSVLPLL